MSEKSVRIRVCDRTFKREEMSWFKLFSRWLIEFFRGEPWEEYLICPKCKELDDFGPSHSWGEKTDLTHCPICGSLLSFFWSAERVRQYFTRKSNHRCRLVYCDDQVASWVYGFPMSRTIFYLDTLAVLPRYRREVGSSVFHNLLEDYLEELEAEGFTNIFTRTHREATVLRVFLAALGFKEGNPSREDPTRTYWRKRKAC